MTVLCWLYTHLFSFREQFFHLQSFDVSLVLQSAASVTRNNGKSIENYYFALYWFPVSFTTNVLSLYHTACLLDSCHRLKLYLVRHNLCTMCLYLCAYSVYKKRTRDGLLPGHRHTDQEGGILVYDTESVKTSLRNPDKTSETSTKSTHITKSALFKTRHNHFSKLSTLLLNTLKWIS